MSDYIIRTISEKCVQCYACIRNCPVKAVAIRNGRARIIQERCIQCGNCVRICTQNAKEVLDGIKNTMKYLEEGSSVALIAPSYPAAFPEIVRKMPTALRSIGFSQVWEVAAGAELVVQACQKLKTAEHPYISSACPSVVNLIQKHYPQFIPFLVPIVSPAIAAARLIRSIYPGKHFSIVFIGPCIAKKGEIIQESIKDEIQEAITYEELEKIFILKEVNWDTIMDSVFDSPSASMAYTFPISGGLLRNLNQSNDILREDRIVIDGIKNWLNALELIEGGDSSIQLIDGLFCNGCIDGPMMRGRDNVLRRKSCLLEYARSIPMERQAAGKKQLLSAHIDLSRNFENLKVTLPQPSEEDIAAILKQTNKEQKEDQMNCGACGYSSCREKAIAVYQGIAEHEICLPYLLAQKNELVKSINEELNRIRAMKEEMDVLIDSSYDGICMTDGQGNIQRVNKPMLKLLGVEGKDLLGKNMAELEDEKILYPSATMLVLRARKAVTFLQQISSGKQVLATGNPVFDKKGKMIRIISNLRDFDQIQKIREELNTVYNQSKLEELDKEYPIIALSGVFTHVLEVALRVAIVDSTVLILGESGVGKEIIARYIHKNSKRADGPFVKINCGALPEALIESELFGYETGAFTGANKEGKKGLFEVAHGGTLFLDEIGELPLTQQVKLLQVIQEKQITRVGGTVHKKVDVRLLAATNRDLVVMVKEGNFRADLFYRLNVIPIRVPPLRERPDDIIPLMYFFLDKFNGQYRKNCTVSKEAKEKFLNYNWPGNVRELENMLERLVVITTGNVISDGDLPPGFGKGDKAGEGVTVRGIMSLKRALEETEKQLILHARELSSSTYKIAELLGVNQSTVVRKLQKYIDGDAKENH